MSQFTPEMVYLATVETIYLPTDEMVYLATAETVYLATVETVYLATDETVYLATVETVYLATDEMVYLATVETVYLATDETVYLPTDAQLSTNQAYVQSNYVDQDQRVTTKSKCYMLYTNYRTMTVQDSATNIGI